jgi:hypothetical protein
MYTDLTQSNDNETVWKKNLTVPASGELVIFSEDMTDRAGAIYVEYIFTDTNKWNMRTGKVYVGFTAASATGQLPSTDESSVDIGGINMSVEASIDATKVVTIKIVNSLPSDHLATYKVKYMDLGAIIPPPNPRILFTIAGLPLPDPSYKDNIAGLGNGAHVLDATRYKVKEDADPTTTFSGLNGTTTVKSVGQHAEWWSKSITNQTSLASGTPTDVFKFKLQASGAGIGGGSQYGYSWVYWYYDSSGGTVSFGLGGGNGGGGGGATSYGFLRDAGLLSETVTDIGGFVGRNLSWQRYPSGNPGDWRNY